jgi:hypothetical protein
MKVTLSVSRKEGRPHFGSEGCSCQCEVELSEATVSGNPLSLIEEARRVLAYCDAVVTEQLAKSAGQVEPALVPYEPEVHYNGSTAGIMAQAPRPAARPAARQPARPAASQERDDPPRNARQLLGWIRKLEDSGEYPALLKRFVSLGVSQGLPSKVLEWRPDEVADAVRALFPADEEPEPAPVARNGTASRNGRY